MERKRKVLSKVGGKQPAQCGRFVDDKYFKPFTQPRMVEVATQLLNCQGISEEAFLGAQAVLILNGII